MPYPSLRLIILPAAQPEESEIPGNGMRTQSTMGIKNCKACAEAQAFDRSLEGVFSATSIPFTP